MKSNHSSFVPGSAMGTGSVCKAGIETSLFGKTATPCYDLKHTLEKSSCPLVPLEQADSYGGTSGGRKSEKDYLGC